MTTPKNPAIRIKMKTYAYITTEACRVIDAAKPGSFIGRDEIPVSKHGDYVPWIYGKSKTLKLREDYSVSVYRRACARAMASLKGWTL